MSHRYQYLIRTTLACIIRFCIVVVLCHLLIEPLHVLWHSGDYLPGHWLYFDFPINTESNDCPVLILSPLGIDNPLTITYTWRRFAVVTTFASVIICWWLLCYQFAIHCWYHRVWFDYCDLYVIVDIFVPVVDVVLDPLQMFFESFLLDTELQ